MIAMEILRWFLLVAEALIALPILYLCIVSISAILTAKKRKYRDMGFSLNVSLNVNFAILIPAHDEEGMLPNLLKSLSALAYPKEQYTVYVVADNCTDRTAAIARSTDWA